MTAAATRTVPRAAPAHLTHAALLVRDAHQRDPSIGTLCDVECGDGAFLAYVKQHFGGHPGRRGGRALTDVWGYDADPHAVAVARARGVSAIVQDFQRRPDLVAWAELVTFVEVLEYLSDPEETLRRLARSCAVTRAIVASSEVAGPVARHSWSLEEYEAMLHRAGWDVVSRRASASHVTVLAERV